ncbi:MAG: hypothetical protein KDK51_01160, partial [Deltaproteobacteria bacterium]|nr:hypothetical protein [Deltaproteobacteria bacterium]
MMYGFSLLLLFWTVFLPCDVHAQIFTGDIQTLEQFENTTTNDTLLETVQTITEAVVKVIVIDVTSKQALSSGSGTMITKDNTVHLLAATHLFEGLAPHRKYGFQLKGKNHSVEITDVNPDHFQLGMDVLTYKLAYGQWRGPTIHLTNIKTQPEAGQNVL